MKGAVVWILFFLAAWALSPGSVANADFSPITLAWIGPLSGNSASLGQESLRGVKLAVDEVNEKEGIEGRAVRLVVEDDSYSTQKAITAYEKIVAVEKPQIVFMLTYGAVKSLAQRKREDNVLIVDPLDCNDELIAGSNSMLCVGTQTESIVENFVKDIVQNDFKSVLVLSEDDDPWMQFISNGLRSRFESLALNYSLQSTSSMQDDYRAILSAARNRTVDALIFLGNDQMGLAMKQARMLGMKAQFYSIASITSPGFLSLAGKAVEGTRVSHWKAPMSAQNRAFRSSWFKAYGEEPRMEIAAIPAYDAAKIMLFSIKQSVDPLGHDAADNVRKAVLDAAIYQGIGGKIHFDADGVVRSLKEKLYYFKSGKLEAP